MAEKTIKNRYESHIYRHDVYKLFRKEDKTIGLGSHLKKNWINKEKNTTPFLNTMMNAHSSIFQALIFF